MLLPICLTVRLSITRVDRSKMVEVRIIQFSLYSSPLTLLFADKFHPQILVGPPEQRRQTRVGKNNKLDLCVGISKTVQDTAIVTTND